MPDQAAAKGLALRVERSGDQVLVRCSGRLVAGLNEYLYTEIRPLIPDSKRIVLDLTELTNMDSMGLGTIVRLYVSAKSVGCELRLIHIVPRIQKMLGVTQLLTVLGTLGETGISYL